MTNVYRKFFQNAVRNFLHISLEKSHTNFVKVRGEHRAAGLFRLEGMDTPDCSWIVLPVLYGVVYSLQKKGMVNKLRKKYLLLAAVLCLSMTALVGCGNQDNNSDNGGQETASPGTDNGNGVMDDVKDGVNDVMDGAEDAVDDAMDGTEDAVDDVDGDTDDQDKNNSVTSGKNDRDNADNR